MSSDADLDDSMNGIADVARSVPFVVLASASINRINMGTALYHLTQIQL